MYMHVKILVHKVETLLFILQTVHGAPVNAWSFCNSSAALQG